MTGKPDSELDPKTVIADYGPPPSCAEAREQWLLRMLDEATKWLDHQNLEMAKACVRLVRGELERAAEHPKGSPHMDGFELIVYRRGQGPEDDDDRP
jgi:hypothetical protein